MIQQVKKLVEKADVRMAQEDLDKEMQRVGKAGLPDQVLQVYDLEWKGGLCPRCRRPWREVKVENDFGKFHYFEPECHCFKKCLRVDAGRGRRRAGCGRWLVEEGLLGINRCTNCGGRVAE